MQNGSIWFAAGLDINILKMIDMDPVVAVEFSASDIKLGIFGDVRLSFPLPAYPTTRTRMRTLICTPYMYVELEIIAAIDLRAGTMLVETRLAPSSLSST